MMGGASVIRLIVMIGASSITLCYRSFSVILTLCSSLLAAVGFNILVMLVWRFLMHARPCGVVAAIAVSVANSSVNARRCWMLVRFGSWQC
jgi:predicted tellurium resistance membrane protein TerC